MKASIIRIDMFLELATTLGALAGILSGLLGIEMIYNGLTERL